MLGRTMLRPFAWAFIYQFIENAFETMVFEVLHLQQTLQKPSHVMSETFSLKQDINYHT